MSEIPAEVMATVERIVLFVALLLFDRGPSDR